MNSIQNVDGGLDSSAYEKMKLALRQVETSGKNKKEADFKEAYPLIEQHLSKKIPFKTVLETFNTAYGCKLHPPGFRKLLLDERKRRSEGGDVLHCVSCGQALPSSEFMTYQSKDVEESNHG